MKLTLFLSAAIIITLTLATGLGDWLLPRLGVDGSGRILIPVAVSAALIVLLYQTIFRATDS